MEFPDFHIPHAEKIEWMIETNGWALEPVTPRADTDPPTPAYAYTIGVTELVGFPEIAVFGLTPVASNGLITLVDVNHHNWSDDAYARFRFLGSDGIISGTIGLLYDYPHGRVDTLSYQANVEPRQWHDATLRTRWIPDAFAGPMASLMEAIETGNEPETSGEDNLGTLRVVHAAYRSATEGRSVAPLEVAQEEG